MGGAKQKGGRERDESGGKETIKIGLKKAYRQKKSNTLFTETGDSNGAGQGPQDGSPKGRRTNSELKVHAR